MKYLCLVYHDRAKIDALPQCEYDTIICEALEFRDELWQTGHFIASSPLQSIETATTIRFRNGMMAITDGPFAETREQLSGFCLIDARDLNDAIRLASRMPPARLGCIEIWPIQEVSDAGTAISSQSRRFWWTKRTCSHHDSDRA